MSHVRSLGLCFLAGIAISLYGLRAADAIGDKVPSHSIEIVPDPFSLIHKGMSMKDVDRILNEDPLCFGTGPGNVGPEDWICSYMKAGLVITYERGRIVHIAGRNASRTQQR